jgi:hypothetical protein
MNRDWTHYRRYAAFRFVVTCDRCAVRIPKHDLYFAPISSFGERLCPDCFDGVETPTAEEYANRR